MPYRTAVAESVKNAKYNNRGAQPTPLHYDRSKDTTRNERARERVFVVCMCVCMGWEVLPLPNE